MLVTCLALIGSGLERVALSGQETRTHPVPYVATAPVTDGYLRESAWQEAPVLTGFRKAVGGSGPAEAETWVRLLFDDDYLYVGAEMAEPWMADLKVVRSGPPMDAIRQDSVEFYLDDDDDPLTYYQFAVGAGGLTCNWFWGWLEDEAIAWRSGFRAKTTLGGHSWVMECRVPFSSLAAGTPQPGDVWRFNFCRNRHAAGDVQYSAAEPRFSGYHYAGRQIRFVDPGRQAVFAADFDGNLTARAGSRNIEGRALGKTEFAAGLSGQALVVESQPPIGVELRLEGMHPAGEGTLELWIQPLDWSAAQREFHSFVAAVFEGGMGYTLYQYHEHLGLLWLSNLPKDSGGPGFPARWQGSWRPGTWHHLACTWTQHGQSGTPERQMWVDGETTEIDTRPFTFSATGTLTVGANWGSPGRTAVDRLRLYGRRLTQEQLRHNLELGMTACRRITHGGEDSR